MTKPEKIPEKIPERSDFQEELDRISQLFENTKINYQVLDEAGTLVYVNQPWLDSLGYQIDDVLGKPFKNFLSAESEGLFLKSFEECGQNLPHESLELALKCVDNSEIIASFSCFCNSKTDDSTHHYHCTFQNITRLRATEEALRATEDKYEGIFRSFIDIYYQTDAESRIRLISPSVEKIGAYKPNELIGRSVDDFFFTPEVRREIRARIFRDGYVDDFDLQLIKKNGERIQASLSAKLIGDKQGNDFYVEGVIRDITRRKKYESDIASYNSRLKDITDNLPVSLFCVNQRNGKSQVKYLSSQVADRFNLSMDEIQKNPQVFSSLLSVKVLKEIRKELKTALQENRTASIDFELIRKSGENNWYRLRASPKKHGQEEVMWTGIAIDISEEVFSRKRIEEQEKELQSLYRYANVGIATMSLHGIVTSINPAVIEMTGYSEEDIVGKHFRNAAVFLSKDLPFYMKLFSNALLGKVPKKSIHFEWKHKNGESRWAEAFLNLIREDGQIRGLQGVFLDVTDRILWEKERSNKHRDSDFLFDSALGFLKINAEEELYQFLAKQLRKLIPEAIINLNSVNDDLSQLRVESLTGMSGTLRSGVLNLLGGSFKGKVFQINSETFSYAKHGKLIQIHDNLYDLTIHQIPLPICIQIEKLIQLREIHEISIGIGDRIIGGCAIFICKGQRIENKHLIENLFRQATETLTRLKTHRQMEQREELYRSLAENTKDMILRVNERAEVIYANHAFLETFELNTSQIFLKPLNLLGFPNAICDLINITVQKTIASKQAQYCDNVLVINETPRFFEWRMFPEIDSKSEARSALMFVHDITRRKEAEARVMHNIENKNKIFRLIGHDLKNPLNSILGFLELLNLRFDSLSDDEKKKYLGYITDSSENLYQLLQSMQEWSKCDDDQNHFNPIFFDLKPLIDASLDFIKLSVIEKGLVIENRVPPGSLIKADYNMIAAAIRNFLSNACKFSYEGGCIDIEFSKNKEEAILVIRDQGTGMSEPELKHLLNLESPFSKTGTKGEKGSGIGFKFAREFIERNNGWIRLNSQVGEGTEIQIGLKTE